jgi:hypothetical protein
MDTLQDLVLIVIAFAAGCAVWNYLGPQIGGELHAEEKRLGDRIKEKP